VHSRKDGIITKTTTRAASGSRAPIADDGIVPVQNRMVIKERLTLSSMSPDEFFLPIPNSPIGAYKNRPCTCTWYRDADWQRCLYYHFIV